MRGFLIWLALGLLALSGLRWSRRVGFRLPEQHRAVATGVINAPPERVWELLTEPLPEGAWSTGVRRVVTHDPQWSDGLVCWAEWRALMPVPLCLAEEQMGRRRVVKTHAWGPMPFDATWTYELAPAGTGTQMTITEESWIRKPLWRLYGRYVLRGRTDVTQQLRDLQTEAVRKR